jgi:hypothetical protein
MKELTKRAERKLYVASQDKDIISLYRKRNRLFKAKYALGMVELEKPVRAGWKKYYVLRDDVSRRDDVAFYAHLLSLVNKPSYSRDKDFMYKPWGAKKRIQHIHQPSPLSHKEYNALTEKQKAFFTEIYNVKLKLKLFHFRDTWMFAEKVSPRFITHRFVLDPELESQLNEIDNKITSQNLWPKIGKIFGWRSNSWRQEVYRDRMRLIAKSIDLINVTEYVDMTAFIEKEGPDRQFEYYEDYRMGEM